MSRKRSATRSRSRKALHLHKPNGRLTQRVQEVGPEHFGIVCVDCAKARSKWLMCDFYGNLVVEPRPVEHTHGHLQAAIAIVRDHADRHPFKDLVVVIERTGTYHLPVKRAFERAEFRGGSFDTRIMHPFATKQHRQPANPGDKTDDNDLAAMFRATVAGFGLTEPPLDEDHSQLRLLARHRRDLVRKRSSLNCQIREHLEAVLPGYAALFGEKLWESCVAMPLTERLSSPQHVAELGVAGLERMLREAGVRFQTRTLEKIVAWAPTAAPADPMAGVQRRILSTLESDRRRKTQEITALEQDLAAWLVRTPYVLLLSCPGINVVSAGELAGEMGPIGNYARASHITGRAGLYGARYQSDEVDKRDGQLIRMCNRRLRFVLMMIAENLVRCNGHYRGLNQLWSSQGQDPRYIRTKVATRFSRLAFQLVAGRQVLRHPGMKGRDYILEKLLTFHQEHGTPMNARLGDLQRAVEQLPRGSHVQEAQPLVAQLERARSARRGVSPIGELLPLVLAKLGVSGVQSVDEPRGSR